MQRKKNPNNDPAIRRGDVKEFIRKNYVGIGTQELADMVNKKFGTSILKSQVKIFKHNHHLDSGLRGYFPKGHVPVNKGKKWEEYLSPEQMEKSRKTCFKKGNVPQNKLPVGTDLMKGDDYVWRKIAEPNKWRQKHRILWEEFHGKKIPQGMLVIFLDGDRTNFSQDNLTLISKAENRILNKHHLRFGDKELTKTGVALARLKASIYEKEREAQ